MTWGSTLALAIAVALFVASPGPGVVALVSTSLGQGFRKGVALGLGMITGDILYMLFAVYGLSLAARELGDLFILVRVLGAFYLVYLGFRLWRRGMAIDAITASRDGRGHLKLFGAGMLTALGNPKTMAFYLGFLPNFMDLTQLTVSDVAIVAVTIFLASASVCAAYAALAAQARGFLASADRRRVVDRVAGTVMIGAGIAVAVR